MRPQVPASNHPFVKQHEPSKFSFPLAALAFLILLAAAWPARAAEGWQASPVLIEKLEKSRKGVNYREENVPSFKLPEVLTTADGRKITSASDWEKIRRPEVLELFRTHVYGRVPDTKYEQTFKVVNEDPAAMGGAATLKQVDITIAARGKSLTIHLSLFIPNKAPKPVPTFLLICNRGLENIDPTRQKKSEFWPAEEVIARGYGVAAFYNGDVDPDKHDGFKDGIHGILDTGERAPDAWGTIAAWAWGASRCMDYFETDKAIARDKVVVLGHSRGGKTALWAGAEDQRFALAISNESGCGGAAMSRRCFGETVAQINKSFPHWFCENYKKYNNNEKALPDEQHMLIALSAGRAVYVASADQDLWADPRGSYLSLANALPAFRLYDPATALPEATPPLNTPVRNGRMAYHVREGDHNLLLYDWNAFMDFADVIFKH